jgi:hypothetical protein
MELGDALSPALDGSATALLLWVWIDLRGKLRDLRTYVEGIEKRVDSLEHIEVRRSALASAPRPSEERPRA